ncbi:hypothetical protein D3C83_172100 [compost metagenome]
MRLVWTSRAFNDISQGNDATPLWIPQIAMAAGACLLLVAMLDDFVMLVRRKPAKAAAGDEAKRLE